MTKQRGTEWCSGDRRWSINRLCLLPGRWPNCSNRPGWRCGADPTAGPHRSRGGDPRPDHVGRRALLELYAGGATVTADLDPAVAATEGATASAMKELMRRAVLRTLERDADAGLIEPPVIDDEVMSAVVADFTSEAAGLSRSLLGAGPADQALPGPGFPGDPQGPEHQRDLQWQPAPQGYPIPPGTCA
jgi:hypothetical protein